MLTAFASFLEDSENKWLSLIALTGKAVLSGRKTIISGFLDSCFWKIVEAKSKAMVCWVR